MFITSLFINVSEEDLVNLAINYLSAFFSAEIEPDSPFHVEFGLSPEFDFGDFIPRDNMSL
jgi:hypothetical protein